MSRRRSEAGRLQESRLIQLSGTVKKHLLVRAHTLADLLAQACRRTSSVANHVWKWLYFVQRGLSFVPIQISYNCRSYLVFW